MTWQYRPWASFTTVHGLALQSEQIRLRHTRDFLVADGRGIWPVRFECDDINVKWFTSDNPDS